MKDQTLPPSPKKVRIYIYTEKSGASFLVKAMIPLSSNFEEQNVIHIELGAQDYNHVVSNAIKHLLIKFWQDLGLDFLQDSRWGEDLIAAYVLRQELSKPFNQIQNETLLHMQNNYFLIEQCLVSGDDNFGLEDLRGKPIICIPEAKGRNKYIQWLASYSDGLNTKLENTNTEKPGLLLHICCAPDLARPLRWLKQYFKLHLFRYNPNIHPRAEHEKRYAQFIKLTGLEKGEYEILEDRYDPKEFFDAFFEKREQIKKSFKDASYTDVIATSAQMKERGDRCNPCYSMRLEQAAKNAAKHDIPYFTSTLLISPKKKRDKLFTRGVDSEKKYPDTKFLRFDFAKNNGYFKALEITKEHKLRRQNYCGCAWTIPKKK